MFYPSLAMIGLAVVFFASYFYEDRHYLFRWVMFFCTKVHFFPSARGKRSWAFFYGALALIWGLGGLIWSLSYE